MLANPCCPTRPALAAVFVASTQTICTVYTLDETVRACRDGYASGRDGPIQGGPRAGGTSHILTVAAWTTDARIITFWAAASTRAARHAASVRRRGRPDPRLGSAPRAGLDDARAIVRVRVAVRWSGDGSAEVGTRGR